MSVDADQLTAYALGTLSEREREAVEKFLQSHPEAREEVETLQKALADMVLELPPRELRPDAEARLLERVRAEGASVAPARPPARAPRAGARWGWLAAAVALVALAFSVPSWPLVRDLQLRGALEGYERSPGAVSRPLLDGRGQPVGRVVRLQNGQVFVALDRAPAVERVYQAWRIAGSSSPRSLGVFPGRSFLSGQALGVGETFAVSLEPPGGSDQPSSAPLGTAQL